MKPSELMRSWGTAAQCALGLVVLAALTLVCLRIGLNYATIAFLYLIVNALLSLMGGYVSSVILSLFAVVLLNYFFTPRTFNFQAEYTIDIVAGIAFLMTSLIVTGLVRGAREQTQAALRAKEIARQAERELQLAIDTIPAFVWTALPNGSRDFANQRWTEIGLSPGQLQGSEWLAAIHPDERGAVAEKWRAAVAAGTPYANVERVRQADGGYRRFLSRAAPLRDDQGKIVRWYGTDTDIEDQKRAEESARQREEELAHVTRVTTLGELTASIAHEVNQPLTGIVTNGAACLRWLGRDVPVLDEACSSVKAMIGDAKRASEVIQKIRALAKKAETEEKPLQINDVIGDVILLTQREVINNGIALRLELAPGLPPVLGDRVQLQQVIINLVINAIEAMGSVDDRPRDLVIRSDRDDVGAVRVRVVDSGTGLDPAQVNRLFTAFVTTKPGGMGMGLAICRSIIEAHQGRLSASRNAETGATFEFTLPALNAAIK
jgi:PAS domain S-box-containing protein